MLYLALGLSLLALLIALLALGRVGALTARFDEVARDTRRRFENLDEAAEASGGGDLRRVVAALAQGTPMTAEMVMEGRTWRDVEGPEGSKMVLGGDARVIDVRTPSETAGGILPGALLIPLDDLEARMGEIPRDGQPTLIYCAMGMRSAAACEFLSSQGYEHLHNLAEGIGAWSGPTVRP